MLASKSITSALNGSLFILSPELRNIVYGHVLTTPNATLEYTADDECGHKQLKQLQYVNKQLYRDFAHLELKFNTTITVSSQVEDKTTATDQFFALLASLPPEKQDWLRTVILRSAAPEANSFRPRICRFQLIDSRVNMFRLAEFCRRMPHMTVKYKLSTFSALTMTGTLAPVPNVDRHPKPIDVVIFGCVCSNLFRGDSMPELWPVGMRIGRTVTRVSEVMRKRRECHSMYQNPKFYHNKLQADNLRFFPTEDIIETDKFPGGLGIYFNEEARTKELLQVWKVMMRKWVAEGL